jgi:V-type H+-transporting ATPase subunit C
MSHHGTGGTFWLVSLPLSAPGCGGRRDGAWRILQERTAPGGAGSSGQLSSNARLEVPDDLRVGTIDALMAQSDELARVCQSVDAVVGKIRRTVAEAAAAQQQQSGAAAAGPPPPLLVDGQTAAAYLQRFRWDEAKYPTRRPLRETVERVAESVSAVEDDLKVRLAELNAVRGALSQAARRATGSLAVRDLGALVEEAEQQLLKRAGQKMGGGSTSTSAAAANNGTGIVVVDTENLSTAFAVVPRHALKEWEASYETLAAFVVPRSSMVVAEDGDSALVRCVLFRRCADEFRAAARAKGYQVREYVPPPPPPAPGTAEAAAAAAAAEAAKALSVEALRAEADSKRRALDGWCRAAYGEAFSALVHLLVVRLFVESILRYGLPPAFLAAVVRPAHKQEARLRAALAAAFGGADAHYWGGAGGGGDEMGGMGGIGGVATSEVDAHPYVSLTLSTE